MFSPTETVVSHLNMLLISSCCREPASVRGTRGSSVPSWVCGRRRRGGGGGGGRGGGGGVCACVCVCVCGRMELSDWRAGETLAVMAAASLPGLCGWTPRNHLFIQHEPFSSSLFLINNSHSSFKIEREREVDSFHWPGAGRDAPRAQTIKWERSHHNKRHKVGKRFILLLITCNLLSSSITCTRIAPIWCFLSFFILFSFFIESRHFQMSFRQLILHVQICRWCSF